MTYTSSVEAASPWHPDKDAPPPRAVAESESRLNLTDGRRRNRAVRRERVYEAAIQLFIEQGFDGTRMDQIAERAGVARATLFNHFERKTAFLDEWSARRRERALASVRAEDVEYRSLADILRRYMAELATTSESTRPETVALIGSAIRSTDAFGNPLLARELAALVAHARDRGEVRPNIDPELVGLLLATAYFAVLDRWIIEPPPFDLLAALLDVVDLILNGVSMLRTPSDPRNPVTEGATEPEER